ncbi:MAG TPA: carboxypeptidase-like regulatory domain-containing protein [Chthoniobacterales bacterium]|nr:carboxypeptidase-like regulatory domain-containing protein [Chthoniobacterales bacterium]
MFTLTRTAVVVSAALLFLAPKVSADAVATLEGIVKDANSQPLKGAEIRIQGSDQSKIGKVHTDARGHYAYPGLETGAYSVTLLVDGVVKASIRNVKTKLGETEKLNFELQKGTAAKPVTKGKHYVWVPSITGSHIGAWIEVDDNQKQMPSGMQERIRNQGNQQAKTWQAGGSAMPNHM